MCQVTPFTLPCCRRIYVEVSKLPSCPDNWPKSKCPPELCIQVRGYEAEDRTVGICWRCKTHVAGKFGRERDSLRPAIDRADIVLGLEDLGVPGRRKMAEDRGGCWFCGTKGVCEVCGTKKTLAGDGRGTCVSPAPKRVDDADAGRNSARNKRVKIEGVESQAQIQLPAYPDPLNDTHWPGPCQQMYNVPAGEFQYQQIHSSSNLGISRQESLSYQAAMPTYRGGLLPNQIGATTDREMVEDVSIQPHQSIHLPGPSPSTEAGLHAREVHDQANFGDFEDINNAMLNQLLESYNNDPNTTFQVEQQAEQNQYPPAVYPVADWQLTMVPK